MLQDLGPPDDVVGESCPSQLDSEPAMMASVRAELPAAAAFRSASPSWLQQRSHIQRDEAEPPRRAAGDWTSRNARRCKAQRPSASAMVLARKRKRDEQRRLLGGKKQCTDSDGSECNAADSEQDSLDMEEQLTAFVEYNATDMDSLDINPSQDFDGGDEEQDAVTQASQHMQTCSWQDVTDVNQFQEEASEVFDNVIYAQGPASVPAGSSSSSYCRPQGKFGVARPSFLPASKTIPEKRVSCSPPSDDSEDSLSDGFDVATNLVSKIKRVEETHIGTSPKQATKPLWTQRRSVKRDCSFLDNSNYSVNGRLLLMASPTPATASEASEASSDRVIELKDGCFDSSDDVQEVPMRDGDVPVSDSAPSSVAATVDTMTVMSSSFSSGSSSLPTAFQPRLVRKRRKVGQMTLDGFFRSK